MPITFNDLSENNPDTLPGISHKIYWTFHENIEAFPGRAAEATTPEEDMIVDEDFDFIAGEKWNVIEINQNHSSLEIKPAGEAGNISYTSMLTLHKSGIPTNFLGLIKNIANRNLVFLVQDTCGEYRILANNCVPAKMKAEGEFKTESLGGTKGSTVSFGFDGPMPKVYKGAIILTPAA